jgi:putative flippase GtrA
MKTMLHKFSAFLRHKECPYSQFFKYVICGGLSVAVDQVVFYALAWRVLPCLRLTDPAAKLIQWLGFSVQEVTESELQRNFWAIKIVCFMVSNAVVYTLNVLYVFQPGRNRKIIEVLLFFCSSLFQFFFIWLGSVLISRFGWEVTYSNVTMLMVSMIVNFIVRKKVVFKF